MSNLRACICAKLQINMMFHMCDPSMLECASEQFSYCKWQKSLAFRYQEGVNNMLSFSDKHQLVASMLHSADKHGLLDLFMVRISQGKRYLKALGGSTSGSAAATQPVMYRFCAEIDSWQTLDGRAVKWEGQLLYQKCKDLITQASSLLLAQQMQADLTSRSFCC